MANKLRGEFSVTFQGAALSLRLGINQICELEEKRDGESIFELLGQLSAGEATFRDLRDLAWAMLRSALPECTDMDAGELLDEIMGDPELFDRMQAAIAASFPEDKAPAPGKPKAANKPRRPAKK